MGYEIIPLIALFFTLGIFYIIENENLSQEKRRNIAIFGLIFMLILGIVGGYIMYKDLQYDKERLNQIKIINEKQIELLQKVNENNKQNLENMKKLQYFYNYIDDKQKGTDGGNDGN